MPSFDRYYRAERSPSPLRSSYTPEDRRPLTERVVPTRRDSPPIRARERSQSNDDRNVRGAVKKARLDEPVPTLAKRMALAKDASTAESPPVTQVQSKAPQEGLQEPKNSSEVVSGGPAAPTYLFRLPDRLSFRTSPLSPRNPSPAPRPATSLLARTQSAQLVDPGLSSSSTQSSPTTASPLPRDPPSFTSIPTSNPLLSRIFPSSLEDRLGLPPRPYHVTQDIPSSVLALRMTINPASPVSSTHSSRSPPCRSPAHSGPSPALARKSPPTGPSSNVRAQRQPSNDKAPFASREHPRSLAARLAFSPPPNNPASTSQPAPGPDPTPIKAFTREALPHKTSLPKKQRRKPTELPALMSPEEAEELEVVVKLEPSPSPELRPASPKHEPASVSKIDLLPASKPLSIEEKPADLLPYLETLIPVPLSKPPINCKPFADSHVVPIIPPLSQSVSNALIPPIVPDAPSSLLEPPNTVETAPLFAVSIPQAPVKAQAVPATGADALEMLSRSSSSSRPRPIEIEMDNSYHAGYLNPWADMPSSHAFNVPSLLSPILSTTSPSSNAPDPPFFHSTAIDTALPQHTDDDSLSIPPASLLPHASRRISESPPLPPFPQTLPEGWTTRYSRTNGAIFFWHPSSGEASWTFPA